MSMAAAAADPHTESEQLLLHNDDEEEEEEENVVIVGGGICGLAMALALHRKGVRSRVLELSDSLRAQGAAIGIYSNGWRALDALGGVGYHLRSKAIEIHGIRDILLDRHFQRETLCRSVEFRCLRRSDLIEALAAALPPDTIQFGCRAISVEPVSDASDACIQLQDGRRIIAKSIIGCDGANSVVAKSLGLKSPRRSSLCAIRGFTFYRGGHQFDNYLTRMRKGSHVIGRIPINGNSVYWFVARDWHPQDDETSRIPKLIREAALEIVQGFLPEDIEMVRSCEVDSLSLTRYKYRPPWELLLGKFSKGRITVGGDAMHVMGPFLGQGGSAALEDAIVLARCLAPCFLHERGRHVRQLNAEIESAFIKYVHERKRRIVRLSGQSYLVGLMISAPNNMVRFAFIILMKLFFGGPLSHAEFDCGHL